MIEQRSNAELRQYLGILLKWWWLLIIVAAVAGASAYLVAQATPKTYASRSTLLVGQGPRGAGDSNGNIRDLSNEYAQAYADIATREPVLRGTLQALNLNLDIARLKEMVSARVVLNSPFVEIVVVDVDAERAKVIAEEISNQLIVAGSPDAALQAEQANIKAEIADVTKNIRNARLELTRLDDEIAKATSSRQAQEAKTKQKTLQEQITIWQTTYTALLRSLQNESPTTIRIIEPPVVNPTPVAPRIPESTALAATVGLVLAAAAALLIESLDDTVKNQEDVRTLLNVAPMGIIPRIETGGDYAEKLVVSKFPLSTAAEAYRMLRTNLQFKMVERSIRSIMVSSTQPMEGKSTTTANLAAVIAQSGKKVILVDADLRRPTQHKVFELSNSTGLTGALLDANSDLSEFMHEEILENLSVMTSGPLPPNPSELLSSKRMSDVIDELQKRCDIVIFDTAPVMSVADATALAGHVDGTLLVIDSGHTRRKMARLSYEALVAVGANVMGVVLNRVSKRAKDSSYTYYYPQRKDNEQSTGRVRQRKNSNGNGLFKKSPQMVNANGNGKASYVVPATSRKQIERQG